MKHVIVIGGGPAGLEASANLSMLGYSVTLVEKEEKTGGHLKRWHALFPNRRPAAEVLQLLKDNLSRDIRLQTSTEVTAIKPRDKRIAVMSSSGWQAEADAVVLTTGFELFDASKKEEYGYGIYDDVIINAELEDMFNSEKGVVCHNGKKPGRIGFVHCVGSRDEKVGNLYCSKVCCVTAVKQAIEVKEKLPDAEVYCFYMDLRMFGRHYEELYKEAQEKYGIQFIRGRLSEASEARKGEIVLKVEDTLLNKPLKISVDLLVLMSGMVLSKQNMAFRNELQLIRDDDNFLAPVDGHISQNISGMPGLFFAGACTGPKNLTDALADARSAAMAVAKYLG
jgi:heterodisulfide reductase subunit A2